MELLCEPERHWYIYRPSFGSPWGRHKNKGLPYFRLDPFLCTVLVLWLFLRSLSGKLDSRLQGCVLPSVATAVKVCRSRCYCHTQEYCAEELKHLPPTALGTLAPESHSLHHRWSCHVRRRIRDLRLQQYPVPDRLQWAIRTGPARPTHPLPDRLPGP